jgi:hypothetical protein
MLECVDRQTVLGRRDYATPLLLVTYGLRAREVATLSRVDSDGIVMNLLVVNKHRRCV